MRSPAFSLLALAAIAACAPFPELDALGPDTGPPPALLPLDQLVEQAQSPVEDRGAALAARAARLKARAAAIAPTPPAT